MDMMRGEVEEFMDLLRRLVLALESTGDRGKSQCETDARNLALRWRQRVEEARERRYALQRQNDEENEAEKQ